jgi:hypothetical protein
MLIDAHFNDVTGRIIGAGIEVHRVLGPGLLDRRMCRVCNMS